MTYWLPVVDEVDATNDNLIRLWVLVPKLAVCVNPAIFLIYNKELLPFTQVACCVNDVDITPPSKLHEAIVPQYDALKLIDRTIWSPVLKLKLDIEV